MRPTRRGDPERDVLRRRGDHERDVLRRRGVLAAVLLLGLPSSGADAQQPPAVRELAVRGFAFEHEIQVPGTPEPVYDAFTLETLAWWDHSFTKAPVRLFFEPRPGGGFFEHFDGAGNGARHAVVLAADRGRLLRFTGPLGLSGQPIEMVHTLTFVSGEAGKTKIRLEVRGTGAYEDGLPAIVKGVWWHFLDEAFRPYQEAKKDGVHPYVAAMEAYRAGRKGRDAAASSGEPTPRPPGGAGGGAPPPNAAAVRSVLAEDARMWFEEKTGPGSPIRPDGEGLWSAWDRFFRSESSWSDARIRKGELRVTVREINDWYRLVDRPASDYFATYTFDAGGRIQGILIHGIPARPKTPDRLDAFKEWARAKRPGLVETLLPDGKIDPALEKARLWRTSLLEWRRAAGLPDPLR